MVRVINVQGVVVESGEGTNYAAHDGHRVSITTETVEEALQLFMHHGVILHGADELGLFFGTGKFAVQQQVAGFQVIGILGQLLNGVAAVKQNALVAVDVGDLRLT